jgi:hypothetical protein
MNNYLKTTIILFCSYMSAYTIIDLLFSQNIQWTTNLLLSIVFEVVGSSFMKASDGFSKWLPSSIVIIAYLTCFYFLSLALKTIPLLIIA